MRSLLCDVGFADDHDDCDDGDDDDDVDDDTRVKGGSPNEFDSGHALITQTLCFPIFNEPQNAHKEPNSISPTWVRRKFAPQILGNSFERSTQLVMSH